MLYILNYNLNFAPSLKNIDSIIYNRNIFFHVHTWNIWNTFFLSSCTPLWNENIRHTFYIEWHASVLVSSFWAMIFVPLYISQLVELPLKLNEFMFWVSLGFDIVSFLSVDVDWVFAFDVILLCGYLSLA